MKVIIPPQSTDSYKEVKRICKDLGGEIKFDHINVVDSSLGRMYDGFYAVFDNEDSALLFKLHI